MHAPPFNIHVTYNFLTALTLWSAGGVALLTWLRAGFRTPGSVYWLLAGFGLLYLGFDEHLSLHEQQGNWLSDRGLELPGFHDVDGIVLIAFGLIGLGASVFYRRELAAHRSVLLLLALGAATTVAAFGLDDFGSNRGLAGAVEERLEWVSSVLYLAAIAVRFGFEVARRQAATAADSVPLPVGARSETPETA